MAPAFLFVDHYGCKIPAGRLGDLMKAGRVELFINVMWRELDMLIQQRLASGTPPAQTLDEISGSESWRTDVIGDGMDDGLDRAIPLMARGIGAKWWTSSVRMVTGGQATRYVLLHLTNSDDGRDLMKECAWSVSPAGGFTVRRSDNPDQQFLSSPSRISVLYAIGYSIGSRVVPSDGRSCMPRSDLSGGCRSTSTKWSANSKKEGAITADEVPGRRFGAAANPVLRLAKPKT